VPVHLKLIVGLGNPGTRYASTRHNAGFWFVDRFAAQHRCDLARQARLHGHVGRLSVDGVDCRLLKPDTHMNESGRAVRAVLDYFHIQPRETLIVHDEIDLDPGVVRLKQGGGHGGHNGLRDIMAVLGNGDFSRLRIGVGHPGHKDDVIDYVLKKAGAGEQELIDDAIARALEVMPLVIKGDMEKAMTALHSNTKPQATSNKPQGKE
jgi:PTH1 family peptidyl-tRNA hydrolase